MNPGAGSDDAPLGIALGLPCAAVFALFAWASEDLTRVIAGPAGALVLLATLLVYGVDRWRDRGRPRGWWRLAGWCTLLLELVVLVWWWTGATGVRWASLLFFGGGQLLAMSYAGMGGQGRGLKYLPGSKALVVSAGVSVAGVGMLDAFSWGPDPWLWWGRREVWSSTLFILGVAGANALLFDLRDLDRDAKAGVPSLPVLWGARSTRWIAASWLVSAGLLSLFWIGPNPGWGALASRGAGVLLGLGQIFSRREPRSHPRSALRYFLTLDGALVVPWFVALFFRVFVPSL